MSGELHPKYGPCDGFGPNGTCSECSGIVEPKYVGASQDAQSAYRTGLAEGFRRGIEAACKMMTKYLVYDSQRAVSWHEIQDTLEAIRALRPEGEKT